jgi:hypothetical protein
MNKLLPYYSRQSGLLLFLCSGLVLLLVPRAGAQTPSQNTQAAPSTSAPATQTDAEKKAAERKKHFEEQKRLLDGGGSAGGAGAASHAPQKDWEFWMDPLYVNMLMNETQEIHMWDWRNNDVSARVSWSLNGSEAVDMAVKHHAILTAKMPGTVTVIGQIDGKTIEAIVTVYRGEKLPSGTPRTVSSPPTRTTGARRFIQTGKVQPN